MRFCTRCHSAFQADLDHCPLDGAATSELDRDPLLGVTLRERYQVQEMLGHGGMGRVYRVRHTSLERDFALKVLFGDLASDKNAVERFKREAKSTSALRHRNLVDIVDFGRSNEGLLYLVMELLDGRSLREELESVGSFPAQRVHRIARQVLRGLSHAHGAGVIHRDLKPDNVMLVHDDDELDVVKVLDFGMAKIVGKKSGMASLTTTGMIHGTPLYMSPEQVRGAKLDERSDLYSLGIMLFEMLTGRPPFYSGSVIEIVAMHVTEPIPLAVLENAVANAELVRLVRRLLSKEAEERPASARETLELLDAAVDFKGTGPVRLPSVEVPLSDLQPPEETGDRKKANTVPDDVGRDPEELMNANTEAIAPVKAHQTVSVSSGELQIAAAPAASGRGRSWLLGAAAVAMLGLGAAGYWFAISSEAGPPAETRAAADTRDGPERPGATDLDHDDGAGDGDGAGESELESEGEGDGEGDGDGPGEEAGAEAGEGLTTASPVATAAPKGKPTKGVAKGDGSAKKPPKSMEDRLRKAVKSKGLAIEDLAFFPDIAAAYRGFKHVKKAGDLERTRDAAGVLVDAVEKVSLDRAFFAAKTAAISSRLDTLAKTDATKAAALRTKLNAAKGRVPGSAASAKKAKALNKELTALARAARAP